MQGRTYKANMYRFGFGGHEKIDEVNNVTGSVVDMGDRWLDTRLGRTAKPDKQNRSYPDMSPYSYAGNNPIIFTDPTGEIIVDPKTGKQVVKVGGEWKTIKRVKKDGSIVYGNVSDKFEKGSQLVLDILTSTKVGTKIYNKLQEITTKVIIDTEDKENKELLEENPANSKWSTLNLIGFYKRNKTNGLYKNVIITPDLKAIKTNAKADGIDFEEKLLQVMSVEKDHISTKNQIDIEASYHWKFETKEALEDCLFCPIKRSYKSRKRIQKRKRTNNRRIIKCTSNKYE